MKRVRRVLPFVISLLLIIVLITYAPWGKVLTALRQFNDPIVVLLLVLSVCYYYLKCLRFWLLLNAMGVIWPFRVVALSYLSAQPISLLPAGEVYRSHALQRYAGVPVAESLPQFTMQGVLEGAAMSTLMLISALALGTLRLPALIIAAIVLAAVIAISRGQVANVSRLLNKLPFLNASEQGIKQFNAQHKAVLTWRWLPTLYGISLVIELCGTAIAYASVAGLGGHINAYQAALLYIIPIIVGFVSLLPGGFGLSEQSAVGVLLLSHTPIATAVAATLIMRVTIVGLGVAYGLAAGALGHVQYSRPQRLAHQRK